VVRPLSILMFVAAQAVVTEQGIVQSEFVYESAPFASAHASTIVETGTGLVAAWFGGTREGAADVGIWLSRRTASGWTPPVEVATGLQPDGTTFPCWNPVLFEVVPGDLRLFYKVGPSPQRWWGMELRSGDSGRTWGSSRRLPDGILGPIKNKPLRLADGTLVSPSSTESADPPSTWRVHFELSGDGGQTWSTVAPQPSAAGPGPSEVEGPSIEAIQPSLLVHPGGRLQAVGRTRSQRIFQTWSDDGGRTWTALSLGPLPNPNSGIDAVTLSDGRHLIVYNHTEKGRSPLNVAVSRDGVLWEAALVVEAEPGEFSYPAVIQSRDGLVHVTYTWKRQRVRHVVIDPSRLKPVAMADGRWPQRVQ
jgi:predicted neuraminidase